MILRRLLESLFKHGVVCVMTSKCVSYIFAIRSYSSVTCSRHPDDLYKNGIQRSSFLPAIDLLNSNLKVTDLDSGTDYRRIPRALSKVYYHPLTASNALEVSKIFKSLTSGDQNDPVIKNRKLTTWGRTLLVPESTSRIAKFNFQDLCGKPLSAADYLEVTKTFGTLFLLDIPKMDLNSKDLVGLLFFGPVSAANADVRQGDSSLS